MIKSFTAVTREIDEAEIAVEEIMAALEPKKNLLKNSLGIISCYSEFVETGVLKAICDALPFDCIGSTTCISSAGKQTDRMILSLVVLTSDDCSFETKAIPIAAEKYEETVNSALSPLMDRSGEKPVLLLGYFPLMNVSGNMILTAIDKTTGGIPLFGTAAIDHNPDFSTSQTIHNGEAFREAAVVGLIYGNVNYTFELASLNADKIRKQQAIITEANGNTLIGVNGKVALEYLEEIGLKKTDFDKVFMPLVVGHKDGTRPVARGILSFTPEGHAFCGGEMTVGATLAVGRVDMEDVISTTEDILKTLVQKESTVLSYSCLVRYLTLGTKFTAEADKMGEVCGDMNYLYASAGGEICPIPDESGKLKNYFHNYTNVFCRLS
ncbi:MAG: FIST C-terminal domain-containing protein [Chitinispirillia bacterium]|nr:FIST C-terminal domain-containing protein [Chitinispirillia bacterium]